MSRAPPRNTTSSLNRIWARKAASWGTFTATARRTAPMTAYHLSTCLGNSAAPPARSAASDSLEVISRSCPSIPADAAQGPERGPGHHRERQGDHRPVELVDHDLLHRDADVRQRHRHHGRAQPDARQDPRDRGEEAHQVDGEEVQLGLLVGLCIRGNHEEHGGYEGRDGDEEREQGRRARGGTRGTRSPGASPRSGRRRPCWPAVSGC